MQYDMHYYATYVMAAAAGIPPTDAQVIATASQFVDDQDITSWVLTHSGEGILGIATAHHPLQAGVRTFFGNSESNDTRPVWVPFHFLPGAQGGSFQEKMVCRKDSLVANDLLDHYLAPATLAQHRPHALHLMGIAAHAYADTFSHYGFSGFSTEFNQVQLNSIRYHESHTAHIIEFIKEKGAAFVGTFTQAARLGHGAVLTNPDLPYLRWSFTYQNGQVCERSNPETFLQACQALYERFVQFASLYYEHPPRRVIEWRALQATVADLLAIEAEADDRALAWKRMLKKGVKGPLSGIAPCADYDHMPWVSQTHAFTKEGSAADFIRSHPYRFFVAADYHRNYVLKHLLPQHGLLVA